MRFGIKSSKNSKRKKFFFGLHWGLFLEENFLEVLQLKNSYKIAIYLSNAIKFLKKM